jgi:uncharacterized protein YbjT (DUF2867 family)
MIVVTGATGRTGSRVAEVLLQKNEAIRVIGRDAGKLARFVQRGAAAFVGDVGDAEAMTRAFEGASSVYLVLPEDASQQDLRAHQERVSDSFSAAVAEARVPFVVDVSSIGAQHAHGTGPIVGLHNHEQKLNRVDGLNVLHLRAAYFMENLFLNVVPIRQMGIMPGLVRADAVMPWIATQDIGSYAAARLSARDFSGHSIQELQGSRDLSMQEVASIVGRAIGKPALAYVQTPSAAMEAAFLQMGVPKKTVALLLEMWEGANAGRIAPEEQRNARNTTPTTIEWFVENVFAPAYSSATSD